MNKFTAIAKKATVISRVMTDREKISMADLIRMYPNGVTINEFDLVTVRDSQTGEDKTYPVFAFLEDPHRFFNGGTILLNIALDWVAACEGDVEKASDELKSEGGVRLSMEMGRSKKGNNITRVRILE